MHSYCDPSHVETILAKLHRHVLVDDTGIWVAETCEEHQALEEYCTSMKNDKTRRFHQRPCQPVVVQRAISTFVPKPRHTVTPPRYFEAVRGLSVSPPPPPYY
jgi:hypothetical protein